MILDALVTFFEGLKQFTIDLTAIFDDLDAVWAFIMGLFA